MKRLIACLGVLALVGCRLSALIGSPDSNGALKFAVQPAATAMGSVISPPVRVLVLDEMGKPDTSFHDRIRVELASNPGGAQLDGDTETDVEGGVATFSNLRITAPGNGYTLRAVAPARPAVASARFNVTTRPATDLEFGVQPGTTPAGSPITPAVQIVAEDDDGETASYNGPVTIRLGSNPVGGTLSGTLTVNAVNGVATFADLSIDRPGWGYKLSVSAPTLSGATSVMFSVSGPPRKLVFIVQPSNGKEDQNLKTVKVAARDDANRTVTAYTGPVTLSIAPGSPGGLLLGTATVNAVDGIAVFPDLRITHQGNNYRLVASSPGLMETTSNNFKIDRDNDLMFVVQPSWTRANSPIQPAVQVQVVDEVGNTVTTFVGGITIDVAPNVMGGKLSGTLTVNAMNGVATFTELRMDVIGVDYHLTAAFAGQPPIVQSTGFVVMP